MPESYYSTQFNNHLRKHCELSRIVTIKFLNLVKLRSNEN